MWKFLFLFFLSTSVFSASPSSERQQELKNLLKNDCGACHGMTLKGGLGSSLLAKDLKDKSDDFLITTILEGRKGTAMPPWKKFLNSDEAKWLVNLLQNKGAKLKK